MRSSKNILVTLFTAISILFLSQVAHADNQSATPTVQLPSASNTDQQCVVLARLVLEQNPTEGIKRVPDLIKCLEGDYFYFDKGAAKIALTHIGQPAVALLVDALKDPSPRVMEGAAIALGMIGPEATAAVPSLKEALRQKTRPGVMLPREAAIALGKIGEIEFLIGALQGNEANVSTYLASQGLGAAGPNAAPAIPMLMEILNGSNAPSQMYAADALGAIGPASNLAVPRLRELTNSPLNFVRRSAGEALINIATPEALEAAKPYQRRKNVYESFFKAMSIFTIMPWLAGVVGAGIGIIAFTTTRKNNNRRFIAKVLYIISGFWLIYAAWEFYSYSIGANIRVDLLYIYPFLFFVTALGLIFWLIALKRTKFDRPH
ncbi:HEAT repeat domain-containing protein [Kaarinaea lacus]